MLVFAPSIRQFLNRVGLSFDYLAFILAIYLEPRALHTQNFLVRVSRFPRLANIERILVCLKRIKPFST